MYTEIDCFNKSFQDTLQSVAGVKNFWPHDPPRIKTIGKLHYANSSRWAWSIRFEKQGDLEAKIFKDGSWFEPIEQMGEEK